jgi:hypothetical protein
MTDTDTDWQALAEADPRLFADDAWNLLGPDERHDTVSDEALAAIRQVAVTTIDTATFARRRRRRSIAPSASARTSGWRATRPSRPSLTSPPSCSSWTRSSPSSEGRRPPRPTDRAGTKQAAPGGVRSVVGGLVNAPNGRSVNVADGPIGHDEHALADAVVVERAGAGRRERCGRRGRRPGPRGEADAARSGLATRLGPCVTHDLSVTHASCGPVRVARRLEGFVCAKNRNAARELAVEGPVPCRCLAGCHVVSEGGCRLSCGG